MLTTTTERSSSRFLLPSLAVLFFCSGASALIYQVLWLRVFGWVFGVTVYAASTVWASFMAGLAIGSALAGRAGDRVRRPLAWFAAAELVIAITALLTPAALRVVERTYVAAYPFIPQSIGVLTGVRFVMALAILIVPTTMMGATLPLVIKSSMFRAGSLGSRVGVLYGSNTFGAIAGTLAAGLALIPRIGMRRTFLVAATMNLAVAASALLMSRLVRSEASLASAPAGADIAAPSTVAPASPANPLRIVLVVFAVSGLVSLALEVVWFRVLTLFLRPTVYGFAIMLATVLAGIAIGSYIVTPWLDRRAPWTGVLAILEMTLAVAVVLSFGPLVSLPEFSTWLTPILARLAPAWLGYAVAGSLLAIFPSALIMGVAFPIGLRLWAAGGDGRHVASRIGELYAWNVAGAIAGSLLGGFILLPALGSRRSLIALAGVTFASGVALLVVSEWRRTTQFAAAGLAAGVFALAVARSPDPFDQFMAQRYRGQRIVSREEGVDATVVVHQTRGGELSLTINGNHQASTDRVTSYVHRRIGHLPMALHRDPRTALVIGLGGGATPGAVSIHGPSVDVVELAGSVVRAAQLFRHINYDVLSRPNVHLHVDDGRNYMLLTRERYDVITADAILPIYAGSGNLYSAEYFRLMRRLLNPGGMVVQWVAGTDAEYKMIARTFLSVFPETTAWAAGSLLVGTLEPLQLRRADFERKLQTAGGAQGLRDLNIVTFDGLQAAFTAGPDELRAFVGEGPLLTDDKPVVEYFLSLPRDRDVDTSSLKGDVRRYIVPQ